MRVTKEGKNMDKWYLSELKDFYRNYSIGEIENSEAKTMLIQIIRTCLTLSNISRKDGILKLEEWVVMGDDIENVSADLNHLIKELLHLIIDGADPDFVSEDAQCRYYSCFGKEKSSPAEKIGALIVINGIFRIQEGENPIVIEEMLLSMLPWNYFSGCNDNGDYYSTDGGELPMLKIYGKEPIKRHTYEELCGDETECGEFFDSAECISVKVLNNILLGLDEHSVQRLLRDVDFKELEIALHGLSPAACKTVFSNMTKRHAAVVEEEYFYMGAVRAKDVVDACTIIVNLAKKLDDAGEINIGEDNR